LGKVWTCGVGRPAATPVPGGPGAGRGAAGAGLGTTRGGEGAGLGTAGAGRSTAGAGRGTEGVTGRGTAGAGRGAPGAGGRGTGRICEALQVPLAELEHGGFTDADLDSGYPAAVHETMPCPLYSMPVKPALRSLMRAARALVPSLQYRTILQVSQPFKAAGKLPWGRCVAPWMWPCAHSESEHTSPMTSNSFFWMPS